MKYVCTAVDCPKYYLCNTADAVMVPANILDFRDICNEKNDYPYFQKNGATIKSLNECLVAVQARAKRTTDRIKADIDILLEEEKQHDFE